jgi:5'-3' exonuclease
VRGTRVVVWDRRRQIVLDEGGVRAKFGVSPESIPDYLALVGDSADGFPGIFGWGRKSAADVLGRYLHIERIPPNAAEWEVKPRRAYDLAAELRQEQEAVLLYRRLATLRLDVPLAEGLDDLKWRGARRGPLTELCRELGEEESLNRVGRFRASDHGGAD